jgi:tyrosyl-tRNA synthetase
LARAVTALVHGADATREAEAASAALFGGSVIGMSVQALLEVFPNVPSSTVSRMAESWPVVELLTMVGVTASKGEATRLIRGGGISINEQRVTDEKARVSVAQAIEGQLFLIRKGKRDNYLVRVI